MNALEIPPLRETSILAWVVHECTSSRGLVSVGNFSKPMNILGKRHEGWRATFVGQTRAPRQMYLGCKGRAPADYRKIVALFMG